MRDIKDVLSKVRNQLNSTVVKDVVFRTIAKCDVFPLYQATRNESFNRFLMWPQPVDEKEIIPQLEKLLRENELNKSIAISLCEKDTGMWYGIIKFTPFRDGLEVSMWLHPLVWNKGVVITSGRGTIQVILNLFNDIPIYNRVRPGNIPMQKIVRKYGFKKIDEVKDATSVGEIVDLYVYKIGFDEWLPMEDVNSY